MASWVGWTQLGPYGLSDAEIATSLRGIVDADHAGYYLGDDPEGQHLARVDDYDGQLDFGYGRCLDDPGEGCSVPVMISTQHTAGWSSESGPTGRCERLEPVLGAPAAIISNSAFGPELVIFTGSAVVRIAVLDHVGGDYRGDRSREIALAAYLRVVGEPGKATTLPPPDAKTQGIVDERCASPS